MSDVIDSISRCVERGKVNKTSPFPADLKGLDGADEWTQKALAEALAPDLILQACNEGMRRVGEKFGRNEVFVPDLLMAAKAMNAVMAHLKPFFQAGTVQTRGTFVIGTVAGDLHDIGKNLVSMVVEGNGWKVVDLGVDVKTARFIETIERHPGCIVGMSALLTTTMAAMAKSIADVKQRFPDTRVIVGGAPLSANAATGMGAHGFAPDPQSAVALLETLRK